MTHRFSALIRASFAYLPLVAALLASAPASAAQVQASCSCTVTCPNGTTCSAKGATGCSCDCGWWSGDASCTSSAASVSATRVTSLLSASAAPLVKGLLEALGDREVVLDLCDQIFIAEYALNSGDAVTYYEALTEMDALMRKLSPADAALVQDIADGVAPPALQVTSDCPRNPDDGCCEGDHACPVETSPTGCCDINEEPGEPASL